MSNLKKYGILILLAYFFLEATSFLFFFISHKEVFSFRKVRQHQNGILANSISDDLNLNDTRVPWNVSLHPYFGFGKPAPSGFDFLENPNDKIQNDPNGVIVGITGGSASWNLFTSSKNVIKDYIAKIGAFKSKNIYIIMLGHFAWKEPQQLTALAYYLSMGGKLDILINLDGHNEVVDAGINLRRNVNPSFPLVWYQLASNVLTVEKMSLISDMNSLKIAKYRWANLLSKFNFSVTVSVFWELNNDYLDSKLNYKRILLEKLEDSDAKARPYYKYGPKRKFTSAEDAYKYFAEIWKNSSIQMYNLAKSNGATYFHFLQPNQYVPNSKTFSNEEIEKYFKPNAIGAGIRRGYPLLLALSKDLKKDGIEFHDLTMIFKNETETMYSDACCHLNKKGRDVLAHHIGQTILQYYESNSGHLTTR